MVIAGRPRRSWRRNMETEFRIEKDSMGGMKVPVDALYGPQTARALQNFPISGYRFPRSMIRALGLIKKQGAVVNEELGELPPAIAQAIIKAAREVIDGRWDEQ